MNKELNTVQYGKITLESLLKKINKDRDDKDKWYRSRGMHQVGVGTEEITLNEYCGFELGDEVTVLQKPDYWGADGIAKYPFDEVKGIKEYPFTGKVEHLSTWFKSNDNDYAYALIDLGGVGIRIGGFGFSLTELIERKLIRSDKVNLGIPDSMPEGIKVKSIHDLVIGKKYRPIKNREYCRKELLLQDIYNDELKLQASWDYRDSQVSAKFPDIEEVPGQIDPSQRILDLIKRLKAEKVIWGYDYGPGGGNADTIDTVKSVILPGFDKNGNEFIRIKVVGLRRDFTADKIEMLLDKGEVSQSFRATEWTTITTELKLIKDKTKLPQPTQWSTMRD